MGLVIYCGKETRNAMGAEHGHQKIGVFDLEVNFLSKLLFFIMVMVTTVIILLQQPGTS